MTNKQAPERMLSDAERELLKRYATADPSEYPTVKRGRKWTWTFGAKEAPRLYATKGEAEVQFLAYISVLLEAARAEAERMYNAESAEGAEEVLPAELTTPDAKLLSDAIATSKRSVRAFAREVLVREPRTVWRWLAGENDLPAAVREKCEGIIAAKTTGAA